MGIFFRVDDQRTNPEKGGLKPKTLRIFCQSTQVLESFVLPRDVFFGKVNNIFEVTDY